ncbi:MAG: Ig-like domain-containing protein [Myxococcota bacterium]
MGRFVSLLPLLSLVACKPAPSKIAIDPERSVIERKGGTRALTLVARDRAGAEVDGVAAEWHSMDPLTCDVDARGVVKALRSGTCAIRASAGDLRADASVRVAIVAGLDVTPSGIEMGVGVTRRFSARVLDDRGQPLIGVGVAWASSDPTIATVGAGGNVTTIETGEVRIVARTEGAEGAAQVFVR